MPGRYLTPELKSEPKRSVELRAVFNREVVEEIAGQVGGVHKRFPRSRFIDEVVADLPALGLKDRSLRIARGLREHLPPDYPDALQILLASLGADDGTGGVEGMGGFRFLPFLNFVGAYGLDHPDASIPALARMTRYFSAEFDVRPFLLRHPEPTMAAVRRWAKDDDWRVRRLASEGTRPRLPWALRLNGFIQDPSPVLAILKQLRDDPHEVVRRSVANNLNDISRDNPSAVIDTTRRWMADASPGTRWIVRHALRTLVKQGDRDALTLLGFGGSTGLTLDAFELKSPRVTLGDALHFRFALSSSQKRPVRLCIDYRVHHLRASGKWSPKTFKLAERVLAPGEVLKIDRRHPMVPITTRRYYAGAHRVELLVNGKSLGTLEFELRVPKSSGE